MTGTTGYLAGVETNAVVFAIAPETTWATDPGTGYQYLRLTGETLAAQKTRQRPNELNVTAQVSQAITTQVAASGALNFAYSYGTYDYLMTSLLNNSWTDTSIAISSGDITFSASSNAIVSTTSSKFSALTVGQWIKIAGSSVSGNNGYAQVSSVSSDGKTLVLTRITIADDSSPGSVTVTGSTIVNSNVFHSLYGQKQVGDAQYLLYPGIFVTGGSLNSQQGQFMQGSFNVSAQTETSTTTSVSSSITAAPTGRVIDTVTGLQRLYVNGSAIAAAPKTLNLTFTKEGAGAQYGIGQAAAYGMIMSKLAVAGSLEVYFKTLDLYELFTAETSVEVSWRQIDNLGNAYIITLPNVTIMNPKITASAPNQSIMSSFELEGNPSTTLGYTIRIDRFPVS